MSNLPLPELKELPPHPTNGVLIDLVEQAEAECSKNPALCIRGVLCSWYEQLYPTTTRISRPGRFEATVKRIAAPTRPSIRGVARFAGGELETYRNKEWKPNFGHHKVSSEGKLITLASYSID